MTDVSHPNTSICEHCGKVIHHAHVKLQLKDRCEECGGMGYIDLQNPVCGHYLGVQICPVCNGNCLKNEASA